MLTVFRYTLERFRGQVIGWSAPLALWVWMVVSIYDVILKQRDQIEALLKTYPPEFTAFFGDMTEFATPHGYLSAEFFNMMAILLGIYAVLAGSGLLASDEENGTLDLVLSLPVSRMALFAGRLLGFVAATAVILAVLWLAFVISMNFSPLDVGWAEMLLPEASLFALLILFGTFALLLSMLLPARRLAGMLAGITLVASYVVTGLARLNKDFEPLARLSPLNYYQGGDAILGLNGQWFAGLLAVAALFALAAAWRFQRRDIRVGGEGGWRLPLPWRRAPAKA